MLVPAAQPQYGIPTLPQGNTVSTSDVDMPAIMTPQQVVDIEDVQLTDEDYCKFLIYIYILCTVKCFIFAG